MSGGIFVLQENGSLVEMRQEPYNAEAVLQRLVEEYPALLAGDQMNSADPRRLLLVKREMGVPDAQNGSGRWALDHLFLDQDGVPTLVEVKCSTNNEIRRQVVGQMLDYAANGVAYWPVESLQMNFAATAKEEATSKLAKLLNVDRGTDAADNVDELDVETNLAFEEFWQKVSANLQAGRLRLLFVADEIPMELQRVIEFLNEKMDTVEVLAVEVKQYVGQQMKTLVPRVIGQTAKAVTKKEGTSVANQQWDKARFFEDMERRGNAAATEVARKLLKWIDRQGIRIEGWGSGKTHGSFIPALTHKGEPHTLFCVYGEGKFETYFKFLKAKPPFDEVAKREELLQRFNSIAGVSLPAEAIDKRLNLELSTFESAANFDALTNVLDWIVQEIQAT